MDLNWCICGKKTEGSFYCSSRCKVLDFGTTSFSKVGPLKHFQYELQTNFENIGSDSSVSPSSTNSSPTSSPKVIPYLGFNSDSINVFPVGSNDLISQPLSLDSVNRRKLSFGFQVSNRPVGERNR
ncbi:hypothetical protein HK096_010033 [Nowakowskiella sp. JEL0078]|nr:hypothetical protein HK096_010033 [Nowakowskiella sp. JEL0078]